MWSGPKLTSGWSETSRMGKVHDVAPSVERSYSPAQGCQSGSVKWASRNHRPHSLQQRVAGRVQCSSQAETPWQLLAVFPSLSPICAPLPRIPFGHARAGASLLRLAAPCSLGRGASRVRPPTGPARWGACTSRTLRMPAGRSEPAPPQSLARDDCQFGASGLGDRPGLRRSPGR